MFKTVPDMLGAQLSVHGGERWHLAVLNQIIIRFYPLKPWGQKSVYDLLVHAKRAVELFIFKNDILMILQSTLIF